VALAGLAKAQPPLPIYKAFVALNGLGGSWPPDVVSNTVVQRLYPLDLTFRGKIIFNNSTLQWLPGFFSLFVPTVDNGPIPQMYAQIRQQVVDFLTSRFAAGGPIDIKPNEVLVMGGPSIV
jgi:hypothetical protein